VTVLEIIQRSSEFLARKGVESPRLQVELMLSEVLQLPRLKLYLNFDRVLAEPEVVRLREMVTRRGEREPLQHILGTACFLGLDFAVNRSVLVPRPETELLALEACQRIRAIIESGSRPAVLDIGTGSGCLAITLAVKCPEAIVHAVDVSEVALDVARSNAARHGVSERIKFAQSDLFAALRRDLESPITDSAAARGPSGLAPGRTPLVRSRSAVAPELRFDVIVSNPPYIPTPTLGTLQPEVRAYDPTVALDGGADGLEFYRRLASEAPGFLSPEGVFLAEFGDDQQDQVRAIFEARQWRIESLLPDLAGKLRIIIARRPLC